jgi:hypothetical protein
MELRNDNNNEKRRRKIIQKGPVLVRSAKPGQVSTPAYQRETASLSGLWKN